MHVDLERHAAKAEEQRQRLRQLKDRNALVAELESLAEQAEREAKEQTNHGRMLYCEGQAHAWRHVARRLRELKP